MKTILITGGATGIGRQTALLFAKNDYKVAITYNNSESEALTLRNEIINMGKQCYIFKSDFSDINSISKVYNEIIKVIGHIDVLVNNAGVGLNKTLIDTNLKEIENLTNVNLISQIYISKLVASQMIKQYSGNIVNISSIWGICGASCECIYSATKAGLIGFTKALAKELAPMNIKVNCVAPGVIETKMNNNLSNEEKEQLKNDIPMQKFGMPSDIAETVYFLVNSNYITGQVISPNGGILI